MKLPRPTIRRLMIAVAIAALLMVSIVWMYRLGQTFDDAYGPGGIIERRSKGDHSAFP